MRSLTTLVALAFLGAAVSPAPSLAQPKLNLVETTQRSAEAQVRRLIEPLVDKYCHEQCKILSVDATVEIAIPEEVAPGFDEIQSPGTELAPSGARIKLLMDDKVGPVSRAKLLELLQQYLDTLDYPVKIDTQIAHFPQPLGTEGKIAELRERIAKNFQNTIQELLHQFCPEHCMLADFDLKTEVVNGEEAQYGTPGEFVQEGGVSLKIRDISGTILMDETLLPEERANILEMAKLRTNSFRHVSLDAKAMKFPRPPVTAQGGILADRRIAGAYGVGANGTNGTAESKESRDSKSLSDTKTTNSNATNSTVSNSTSQNASSNNNSNSTESATKQERFERIEKIERVENGDAVQAELQKFKVYGLVFGCSILSLLIFIAMASWRSRKGGESTIHRVISNLASDPVTQQALPNGDERSSSSGDDRGSRVARRYEIDRLVEELSNVFAQHPKVAKHVFTRILTEEGVEVTAQYIHVFGEAIVVDMLRDASLQADLAGLMEFYAKTPIELDDEEKLDLLRRLHNRTVAGKLAVLGNRSSNLFDFLTEMDSTQILELIRTESLTVKAIVLTQCDAQKRGAIYSHLNEDIRMKLLAELSRIDYLPRDYVYNVSTALKRKRRDNPKLNTEALPGSEVLVTLLERTGTGMQRQVVKSLEAANPESARTIKSKLVSIETLRYLRDNQLLEVVLSLKHDELLQFLKGATAEVRNAVFSKSPKELVLELEEELAALGSITREGYQAVERKVLNRMKLMANDGLINLVETNERMFGEAATDSSFVPAAPPATRDATRTLGIEQGTSTGIKKVSGW